jgi:rod shape-determining protein MreC
LTAYSARHPALARGGTALLNEIIAPIHVALDIIEDSTVAVWRRYVSLMGVERENEALRTRLNELLGGQRRMHEFEEQNKRLRALLDLNSAGQLRGVAAEVIGDEPSGWGHGFVINKGSSHGVRVGMAVVHPRGIVGQVIAASANYAHILLITDHSSGVDALIQESRVRGVVEGVGAAHCELRYVTKQTPVRTGDAVITSGLDGVFPKGLIIGSVSKVAVETGTLLQNIEVKVAVDFSRLEEVLVLAGDAAQFEKMDEARELVGVARVK